MFRFFRLKYHNFYVSEELKNGLQILLKPNYRFLSEIPRTVEFFMSKKSLKFYFSELNN